MGGYRIEVSSANRGLRDARVELRLDAADGPVVGEAPLPYTGGKANYVVLSGAVKGVKGIHDLFIVARAQGADAAGHLFNINWFTFTKRSPGPEMKPRLAASENRGLHRPS